MAIPPGAQMARIRRKTSRRLVAMAGHAIRRLLVETIDHTPVITGRLVAGFGFGAGSPNPSTPGPIVPYPSVDGLDASSMAWMRHQEREVANKVQNQVKQALYPIKKEPIGYLTDSVEYAVANEAGTGLGERLTRSYTRRWDYGPNPKHSAIKEAAKQWPAIAAAAIKRAIMEEN